MTTAEKIGAFLLVLYTILVGIGSIATLAPFEGHDELGHFSLIRQVAQEGSYPAYDKAKLDQSALDYMAFGPMPYVALTPYTADKPVTYPDFWANAASVAAFTQTFRAEGAFAPFHPSETRNWQIQHPPLYYLAMAPFAKLVEGDGLSTQLFVLRLVSYVMALAGLAWGLWGTIKRVAPDMRGFVLFSGLLYPVIFPQFFPEFARMGNDSLCALIMSALWVDFLAWQERADSPRAALRVGLWLMLGLLTKGFFIPVAGALALYHLLHLWAARREPALARKSFAQGFVLAIPVLCGAAWYLYQAHVSGSLIGHLEYMMVDKRGGTVQALVHALQGGHLFNGIFNMIFSWSWAGYASMGRFSELYQMPVALFGLWIVARAVRALRRDTLPRTAQFPALILLIMIFALVHHLIIVMGLVEKGGTPAWYLHIFAIPFVYWFAFGIRKIFGFRIGRILFWCLSAYSVGFFMLNLWGQAALTAACAVQPVHKIFVFSKDWMCLADFSSVYDRLSLLAHPDSGGGLIGVGFACLLGGLCLIRTLVSEKQRLA